MLTEYFYLHTSTLPDREQGEVSVCRITFGDVTVIENVDDLMYAMSSEL